MSVVDVQRAFQRGLDDKAACKTATIDYEQGGKYVRLGFHVVSNNAGSAYLSETIPADMCAMQHARYMAQSFLEGRISGQSRYEIAPSLQSATIRIDAQPAPQAPAQAPASVVAAPVVAPVASPALAPVAPPAAVVAPASGIAQPLDGVAPDDPELDAMIDLGDLPGVIDRLCGYVDGEADALRSMWLSQNPGQFLEYEQVRREINDLAYKLIPATPQACPCLWASVGTDVPKTGNDEADIRSAAAVINQCIDATNGLLVQIRAARLQAKSNIRASTTIEDALEVYQSVDWPSA